MAVVLATRVENLLLVTYTWTNMAVGDTGAPVEISDLTSKFAQVTSGGAGTAQVRATADGTNFVALTAALAIGAGAAAPVGIFDFPINPRMIDISAVAVATVTVTLIGLKRKPM